MDEFHFAVARVATAHICRAAGIERSNTAVLDTFTDILTRYLMLLGSTAKSAYDSRDADSANIADAMLAISKCGAVKQPERQDIAYIDDIVEFLRWLRGPLHSRMVFVAVPQLHFGAPLQSAQPPQLALLPPAPPGIPPVPAVLAPPPVPVEPFATMPRELQEIRHDWLRTAINKQILIGHKDWFINTEFGPLKDPDCKIYGDEP